ncbi:TIGR00645 family protein [Cellulomonas timonensis]|uniref:TIGR00645 family protein n=1 Tax=Cellulomonas timonensis TaxID=1689271 RepID=UPI000AD08882|nr:TIGR00645 family protein [Cellulomonas timonensis]
MATRTQTSTIGSLIFMSRWLQVPLYLGLIVAQATYVWQFMIELWHLFSDVVLHSGISGVTEESIMLAVLGLVDVVMIANLLIMVIIGGYETFVSRINLDDHPDQPEWLSHVNANVLKTKLAMSIIGISSIHLLRTFIEAKTTLLLPNGSEVLLWQTVIHLAFIASAMALAWIDKISHAHAGPAKQGPATPQAAPADAASDATPSATAHDGGVDADNRAPDDYALTGTR